MINTSQLFLDYEDSRSRYRILLLGATGGLGQKLLPFLYKAGHDVVTHGHSNGSADYYCDLSSYPSVVTMLDSVGNVDALINMSGVFPTGAAHKYDKFSDAIEINLAGTIGVIRAILPRMRAMKFGRIITTSSVLVDRPEFGTSTYVATKAGIEGFTKAIALENAKHGITCNCISLGYMDGGIFERASQQYKDAALAAIPMQRAGNVSELHNTIEWLLHTEYVTGQVIGLNGGLT